MFQEIQGFVCIWVSEIIVEVQKSPSLWHISQDEAVQVTAQKIPVVEVNLQ
jgi:hypothetical protein